LKTLAQTPQPDDAFAHFDRFLEKLPAGVPIFSMFAREPAQMTLVAGIMGGAPALAEDLGTHPEMLDGVLTQDFFGTLPSDAALKKEAAAVIAQSPSYEQALDAARRWAREKKFHAGIHML